MDEMTPISARGAPSSTWSGRSRSCRYNNYRSVTLNGSPAPGRRLRGGARRRWRRDQRPGAAARLRLRLDRHRAPGEGGRRADDPSILALALVFAYLFLVASTRAGRSPFPFCFGLGLGRLSALALMVVGLPFTSTPRSASSCSSPSRRRTRILIVDFAKERREAGMATSSRRSTAPAPASAPPDDELRFHRGLIPSLSPRARPCFAPASAPASPADARCCGRRHLHHPVLYVIFQPAREWVKRRTGGQPRIDSEASPGGG